MTLTRWWLAAMMVVTLGVGGSWGQSCGRAGAQPPDAPCQQMPECQRAVRHPYYFEVPAILYPAATPTPCQATPCSTPEACQRVFEAIARSQAEYADHCAGVAAAMASWPTEYAKQMYLRQVRFFLATGHCEAAAHMAQIAMKLFPSCPECCLLQRFANAEVEAMRGAEQAGDQEACEEPVPAKGCGCAKDGCCCKAAKACGAAKCACPAECACCKDGGCTKDCCCTKDGCCARQAAAGMKVIMIRMNLSGAVKVPAVKVCPCMPVPAASPAPKVCAFPCVPVQSSPSTRMQVMLGEHNIRIVTDLFEAEAKGIKITRSDYWENGDMLTFEGGVSIEFKTPGRPARVVADSISINLKTGGFTVNGPGTISASPLPAACPAPTPTCVPPGCMMPPLPR